MRKALLVGINKYRLGCNLRGCVNDVQAWLGVLRAQGWSAKEIRVLTDERATAQAILQGLEWLVGKCRPGDVLFFFFSGHGSQIRDLDGDELSDHLDELLCPHDFNWDGTWITDDHLALLFSQVPRGVVLDVVFDCCHSGTMERHLRLRPYRAKFIPPPLDFTARLEPLPRAPLHEALPGAIWSACREDQVAQETIIGLRNHGLFTHAMVSLLRRHPNLARADLHAQVVAALRRYPQVPLFRAPRGYQRSPLFQARFEEDGRP